MAKQKELDSLNKVFKYYDENLLNKEYLIIYSELKNRDYSRLPLKKLVNLKKVKIVKLVFKKENFLHLAGIKLNEEMRADFFYNKLAEKKIKKEDFKTTKFTRTKHLMIPNIVKFLREISIAGSCDNFNRRYSKFKVDRILGVKVKIENTILGINKIREQIGKFENFVPSSILKGKAEDFILPGSERKILVVFSKNCSKKKYDKMEFKYKEYPYESIYKFKEIYNILNKELKEEILLGSSKFGAVNRNHYDLVTGNLITIDSDEIIKEFSSLAWITKEDAENYKMEIKKDQSSISLNIQNSLDDLKYYNLEQLKINKNIEEVFKLQNDF